MRLKVDTNFQAVRASLNSRLFTALLTPEKGTVDFFPPMARITNTTGPSRIRLRNVYACADVNKENQGIEEQGERVYLSLIHI